LFWCTPATPSPMLSFASHQLSERQVWALGRLASRVVGLDLAERRDALRGFHAERPDFTNAKTYKSFNHRQGAKNRKEEFFTRHARTPPKASDDLMELATQLAPLLGLPSPKANATRPPMANDGQTAVASRDGVDPREAAYAERSQRKRDAWWTPWSGARR
jgi:hypothetical protein